MRLWPYEVFKGQPIRMDLVDYESYLDQSILIEGGPGDILYWPSSYWHVGESDGELNAASSLGFYYEEPDLAGASFGKLFSSARQEAGSLGIEALPVMPAKLPRSFLRQADTFSKEAKKFDFEGAVVEYLMNRTSGRAFEQVPAAAPYRELQPQETVRVAPGFPILAQTQGKRLFISAHGHSVGLGERPWMRPLIRKLNSGTPFTVDSLTAKSRPRGEAASVRKLLEVLLSFRGLELGE
jgi:hypothetical protein